MLEPWALEALDGLRPGDRVVVLTWLHLADRGVLRVHPRDDRTRPLQGVFATRSSDRPKDGTPIVDLKPVLRETGRR